MKLFGMQKSLPLLALLLLALAGDGWAQTVVDGQTVVIDGTYASGSALVGGGSGGRGGGGGGGLGLTAPNAGGGNLTGGKGSALNVGGLLDLASGGSGGGGGIDAGGQGYYDEDLIDLDLGKGGGGGSLGITKESGTLGNLDAVIMGTGPTYAVEGGHLDIFGGSGSGGGLVDVLGLLGAGSDGAGKTIAGVTQSGGVVNVLGGVGGGGGTLLNAYGGAGHGSTVTTAEINGGIFNVFGGAGGGANGGLLGFSDGGDGTGGTLASGSMSTGTLNVFGGANGGNLGDGTKSAPGGAGGGGTVKNFTLTGGTMNLYAGTNDADRTGTLLHNSEIWYGGGSATADTITNQGGVINLYGGSLTGAYTQSGANSVLNLGGGTNSSTGMFFGGAVNAVNHADTAAGGRTLDNATFSGEVHLNDAAKLTDGQTLADLNVTNAALSTGANLHVGDKATLTDATNTAATVTLHTGGKFGNSYTQSGTGTLALSGVNLSGGDADIVLNGGSLNAVSADASTATGLTFNNTVTTNAAGSKLTIENATLGSAAANLIIGENVTLSKTTHATGTVTLQTGGVLGAGGTGNQYTLQDGGTLNLGAASSFDAANAVFKGGVIGADAAMPDGTATLAGATLSGDTAFAATADKQLKFSTVTVSGSANVTVTTGVTLDNTAFTGGTITLSDGAITGTYTQSGAASVLNLSGGDFAATGGGSFSGGEINALGGARTLVGADFSGEVWTNRTGATTALTVSEADITGTLHIGGNVTLSKITQDSGTVVLHSGGILGAGGTGNQYTLQDGGTLSLASAGSFDAANAVFEGGGINTAAMAANGTATLTGATLSGDTAFSATDDRKLVFSGVTVTGMATVNLTTGVTLENATVNSGTINAVGGDRTLDSATFTGDVTTNGTVDGSALAVTNASVTGGNLHIRQNVTLRDAVNTDAVVTLHTGGTLGGSYTQSADGILALSGASLAKTGADITITGGTVKSVTAAASSLTGITFAGAVNASAEDGGTLTIADAVLSGATLSKTGAAAVTISGSVTATTLAESKLTGFTFDGAVTASAAGSKLTIDNAALASAATLIIGENVTLSNTANSTGTVRVTTGGALAGTYAQTGAGALELSNAALAKTGADAITISGGGVKAIASGGANASTITGFTFANTVTASAAGSKLTIENAAIASAATLIVGENVTLSNTANSTGTVRVTTGGALAGTYAQTGAGALELSNAALSKTGADSITISGGSVKAIASGGANASTITGFTFANTVTASAAGSKLTIDNAALSGAATLEIGENVTLSNTSNSTGTVRVTGGGALAGTYAQTGAGTLELSGAALFKAGADAITISGGGVKAVTAAASSITGLTFSGAVDASAEDGGTLTIADAVLSGATLSKTGTAAVTVSGSVTATTTDASTLTGFTFAGTVTASAAGSTLTIENAALGTANLHIGENVTLSDTTHGTGTVTLHADGALGTGYTLQGGGTLALADAAAYSLSNAALTGGTIAANAAATVTGATLSGNTAFAASTANTLTFSGVNVTNIATVNLTDGVTLNNAAFNGGTVNAVGGARAVTGADISGEVWTNTAATVAALSITDADILTGGTLHIGKNVTLSATEHDQGAVTLHIGGTLGTGYSLESTATLALADAASYDLTGSTLEGGAIAANAAATVTGATLSGNTAFAANATNTLTFSGVNVISPATVNLTDGVTLNSAVFNGGTVNAVGGARTLSGADFGGEVWTNTVATVNALTITAADILTGGTLHIGESVTLSATTHDAGTVALHADGALGTGYSLQTGGTLALADADTYDLSSAALTGGTINSLANATVTGAKITGTGTVAASADAGSTLTITNADIAADAALALNSGASLSVAQHDSGTIRLNTGGTLTGAFELQTGGTLTLAGGTYAATGGGTFSGGTVNAVGERTLENADFTGKVTTNAVGAGNSLLLKSASLTGSADLTVGTNVTLESATLAAGDLTIDGGALSVAYAQTGGTLNLKSDLDLQSGGLTNALSGGTLNALDSSTLANATITANTVTATAAADKTLTLTNASVAAGATLNIGDNAILSQTVHNSGTVTLHSGGMLGTGYSLEGTGTLALADADTYDLTGSTLKGGAIAANAATTVTGATLSGATAFTADTTNTLTFSGVNITDTATVNLTEGVTLTDASFNGGEVNAIGGARTLTGAEFGGEVWTNEIGTVAALSITDADILTGGTLHIGENVTLSTTEHKAGTVALHADGALGTGYSLQNGGTLALTDAAVYDLTNAALTGGTLTALATATATGAKIIGTGTVTASAATGETLTLANADIAAGATLNLGTGASLSVAEHDSGTILLSTGGTLTGAFELKTGGTLTLAGGTYSGVGGSRNGGTFSGGTINAVGERTLENADFTGTVTANAAGDGNSLLLKNADITGASDLTVGINVTLDSATLASGDLTMDGGSLGTAFTQTGGTLHLNKDLNLTTAGVTNSFSGGRISAKNTSTLTGANIAADTELAAENGNTLTLYGTTIDGSALTTDAPVDIEVGGGVILENTKLLDGVITLNTGGTLSGLYEQSGADSRLVLNVATTGDADIKISGGTVESRVTGATLEGAQLSGTITLTTNGGASSMLLDGTVIHEGTDLDIRENVHLINSRVENAVVTVADGSFLQNKYTQVGADSRLILDGGDTAAQTSAWFDGGTIEVLQNAALRKADFTKQVAFDTGSGATLTIDGVTVYDGGAIEVIDGITLNTVELKDSASSITYTGGTIGRSYTQSGGTLILQNDLNLNGLTTNFSEGEILALGGARVLDYGTFSGKVTFAADSGTLTVSHATLTGEADLTIASGVTLDSATLAAGKITLTDTGTLSGTYTQSADAALNLDLAAGTLDLAAAGVTDTFNGGTINAVTTGTLSGASIAANTTTADAAAGATLTLTNADLAADAILQLGRADQTTAGNVILQLANAHAGGEIILNTNSALTGAFEQKTGGALTLAGGAFTGGKFSGGTLNAVGDRTLANAEFSGAVTTNAAGLANRLKLESTRITGGTLIIGENVTLDAAANSAGTVTLANNGKLSTSYAQTGSGTLVLAGGSTGEATLAIKGGTVRSDTKDGALTGVAFDSGGSGDAITLATGGASDSTLTLNNSTIANGTALTVGKGVILNNTTENTGAVTLDTDGTLTGGYYQREGGLLVLAGGAIAEDARITIAGGTVRSDVKGATFNNATFSGNATLTTNGGESSMTLTGSKISGGISLAIGENVVMENSTLLDGHLELDEDSNLTGHYAQTDADNRLILNGGGTDGQLSADFDGGVIEVRRDATLRNVDIDGRVEFDMQGGKLLLHVVRVNDRADITAKAGVTLNDAALSTGGALTMDGGALGETYAQTGGTLNLTTHLDLDGVVNEFTGGDIISHRNGLTVSAAVVTGGSVRAGVDATDIGANLLLDGARVSGGTLYVGKDVTLAGTSLAAANIVLEQGGAMNGKTSVSSGGFLVLDGGTLTGDYKHTDATLLLQSGAFAADSATLNGGRIHAATGGTVTLANITFGEGGLTATHEADTALAFTNATIDGGTVALAPDIPIDVAILRGSLHNAAGNVTLNGIESAGTFTQDDGALALRNGITTAANTVTLRGGSVAAAQNGAATLHGATILKGTQVTAGADDGTLALSSVTVDGGDLLAHKNTTLSGMSVRNDGTLRIQNETTLGGTTTIGSGGGIRFVDQTPGNTARIADLAADADGGGTLHFTVDTDSGETDYYIVEKSAGSHLLAVTLGGTGKDESEGIDILTDVTDGAEYSLADGGFDENGALLVRYDLTSRPEEDNSRIWSLGGGKAVGLTSSAEGVGNAPAIALAQAAAGMAELGGHFRSLRETDRAARADGRGSGIWAASYTHHMSVETLGTADMNMSGMDIGFEKRFDVCVGGSLYAGVVAGGQWLSSLDMKQSYGKDGSGSGKSYSLGAYALWMNSDGWYADVAARHFWTDLDLTSYDTAGSAVRYAPRREAFAVSAEFGRKISLGVLREWYIEPGLGLTGIWMNSDRFSTGNGQDVEYGATRSLQATAGFAIGYDRIGSRLIPRAGVAFVHGFDGRTAVRMAGTQMRNDPSGTRVRAGLGATYALTDNISLSVDAAYERGARYRDVNGNFGINFSW